jgi:hypothetical protein
MQMTLEGRKIITLMDNVGSHDIHGHMRTLIGGFNAFVLLNIITLFLPSNVTSMV